MQKSEYSYYNLNTIHVLVVIIILFFFIKSCNTNYMLNELYNMFSDALTREWISCFYNYTLSNNYHS